LQRAFRTGMGKARKDFLLIMALIIPIKWYCVHIYTH
jgi:hypothetical protein